MLAELCKELNNWDFQKRAKKYFGEFIVANGELINFEDKLQDGQYFRIVGSIFNDGIYIYGSDILPKDEIFDGKHEPIMDQETYDKVQQKIIGGVMCLIAAAIIFIVMRWTQSLFDLA